MSKKHKKEQEHKEKMLEQELHEYKNKYLLLLADAENARKRLQKEKEETIRYALENTLMDFLPSIDQFDNALQFTTQASSDVQSWAKGFEMILSQFREILHSYGIVAYHAKGCLFDPTLHEATEIVETLEHPEGTILQEFTKGYKTNTRTLRHAQVKVARLPKAPEPIPAEKEEKSPKEELQQ